MRFLAFSLLIAFGLSLLNRASAKVSKVDVEPGLVHIPSLRSAEEISDRLNADLVPDKTGQKSRLVMQQLLKNALEKLKDLLDKGKAVKEDFVEKMGKLRNQLSEFNAGEKIRQFLTKVHDGLKRFFEMLMEKLGLKEKQFNAEEETARASSQFQFVFEKLRKMVLDFVDKETVKKTIEGVFGIGNELSMKLESLFGEKSSQGKKKMVEFINEILEKTRNRESRSLSEVWEKLKDYFKDLKIDLEEKYLEFGSWVKEFAGKTFDGARDKVENLQKIARAFIVSSKILSKEVMAEGLEFLQQYKDDLGVLWDQVMDAAKEALNKKE